LGSGSVPGELEQGVPGIRIDDAVGGEPLATLKKENGLLGLGTEDAVGEDVELELPEPLLELEDPRAAVSLG
jgi:hypothetical protein